MVDIFGNTYITILDKLDIRKWDGSDAQKFKVTVENLLSDVLKGNKIHRQQLFFLQISLKEVMFMLRTFIILR